MRMRQDSHTRYRRALLNEEDPIAANSYRDGTICVYGTRMCWRLKLRDKLGGVRRMDTASPLDILFVTV